MHYFMEGGQFMYVILLLDMILLGVAIFSMVVNKRKLQYMSLAAALSPVLFGYLGYKIGMIQAHSAIPLADPALRPELLEMSREIAQIPLIFGTASTIVLVILILSRMVFNFRSTDKP